MTNREEFDLRGWKFILTYGRNLKIYGRGRQRVGISDGKAIIFYKMKRGNIEKEVANEG